MRIGKKARKKISPIRKIKNRIGRPKGLSGYDEKYDHIAEQACAIGANTNQLAQMLDITVPTLEKWKRDNYNFFKSIKNGRDKYDTEYVESSLLKRAQGYDKQLMEERLTKNGDVVECKKTIHVSPDVGAAIFWLCNRNPNRWKQVSQARFQQLNLYQGNGEDKNKLNGKGKKIDGTVNAGDAREIIQALHESGALPDTGFSVPVPTITEGDNSKTN